MRAHLPLAAVLRRIAASSLVIGGAAVFLVVFGPRPGPVYADIYGPIASAAGFLRPPAGGPRVQTGQMRVNGEFFNYSIGHTALDVDQTLSYFEQQFETTVSSEKLRASTRFNGAGAGVVTGVRFGALARPDDFGRRLERFARTRRFSDFGQFHVVSAYAQQGTVFIDFTPAPNARLDMLVPRDAADSPGQDPLGVSRPPDLQRLLTIDQGPSRTIIYRTTDSGSAVAAFGRALQAAGFTSAAMASQSSVGHYFNAQRQCYVAGIGSDANSVLIFVERLQDRPRTQP